MATKNQRANARDPIRDAIKPSEDLALGRVARERAISFKRKRALRHREVWSPRKRSSKE